MRVSLFIPCLVDTLLPRVGEAAAAVLMRLGLDLDYPREQTCCGQPAFNAGRWEDARRVARQWLKAFAGSELIVCPSGSCVSMVRNHYPRLFADHPQELGRARELGPRTFELCEFLVKRMGVTELGATWPGKVAYHHSCHLNRELGVRDEPRDLLRAVRGLELCEMQEPDRCCGFGGVFSVKFPEVSAAMARRKMERINESGAGAVVTCDPGCLIQIKGYLSRNNSNTRVLHMAEILAGPRPSIS